jgi:hypothetical protein
VTDLRVIIYATDPLIGGSRIVELGSGPTLAAAREDATRALTARGHPRDYASELVAHLPAHRSDDPQTERALLRAIRDSMRLWVSRRPLR